MSLAARIALLLLGVVAVLAWRAELYTVQQPGIAPAPLTLLPPAARLPIEFDAVLPVVPVGMRRLASDQGPILIHYWAPWQHDGRSQARDLDSLAHDPDLAGLHIAIVCFDPFPSVARYVGRNRLTLPVLLDGPHVLASRLPCPSIPYTYLIDANGRIAGSLAGDVDWWAPATIIALRRLIAEPVEVPPAPAPVRAPSAPIS